MTKTIKMKDVYDWLSIMENPHDYDKIKMYYRFAGALDILNHLGIITWDEKNSFLDNYFDKYLTETGA